MVRRFSRVSSAFSSRRCVQVDEVLVDEILLLAGQPLLSLAAHRSSLPIRSSSHFSGPADNKTTNTCRRVFTATSETISLWSLAGGPGCSPLAALAALLHRRRSRMYSARRSRSAAIFEFSRARTLRVTSARTRDVRVPERVTSLPLSPPPLDTYRVVIACSEAAQSLRRLS